MIEARVKNGFHHDKVELKKGKSVFIVAVTDNEEFVDGKAFVVVYAYEHGWNSLSVNSSLIEVVTEVKDLSNIKEIPYFEN